MDSEDDITIVVDSNWTTSKIRHQRKADLVTADRKHSREYREDNIYVTGISNDIDPEAAHGEWIGLAMFSAKGTEILKETLEEMHAEQNFNKKAMVDVLSRIMKKGFKIRVEYIHGHWLDIDNLDDVSDAYIFEGK